MKSIVLSIVLALSLGLTVLFIWSRLSQPPEHCCDAHEHPPSIASAAPALDGASLYQIESTFTDQDGRPFTLASLRGQPVLVAMFYTSCTTVCPMIIAEMQRIEAALPEADRATLRLVLVTFDSERDTPERLRAVAAERGLPTPHWTLARGDDDAIRELAMALGVQYRRIEGDAFVHSALVTLLDREGRIASQLDGVDAPIAPLVSQLEQLEQLEPSQP